MKTGPFRPVFVALFTILGLASMAHADYKVTLVSLKNSDGDPAHDLYFKVVADGKTTKIPKNPSQDCHFIVEKYTTQDLSDLNGTWKPVSQKPKASDLTFIVKNSLEVSLWDYNGVLALGVDGNKGFIKVPLEPGEHSELLKPLNVGSDISGGLLATHYTLSYTVSQVSSSGGGGTAAKGDYQILPSGGAKLRKDPSDKAGSLATLSKGEWVNFISKEGETWRRVKVVSSGKVGWVKRSELGEYRSR